MIRDYRRSDRDALVARKFDGRMLDSGELQVVIADNVADGHASFLDTPGRLPILGAVKGRTRRLFYQLIDRAVEKLIAAGNERGEFFVKDPRVKALVERDFDVVAEPVGKKADGSPGYWRFEVDLANARRQLARRI